MSKLLAGSTLMIIGVITYFGTFITISTILANNANELDVHYALEGMWNYYPTHYAIAITVLSIGVIFFLWGLFDSFRFKKDK